MVSTAPNVVTINPDRVLEVNGHPFFPIGARHMPEGATLAHLRDAGFNSVRWTAFGTDTTPALDIPVTFDDALFFYAYVFTNGDLSEDGEHRRAALTTLVERVKTHPRFLCYEQRNEPASLFRQPLRRQSPPEGMAAGSALIRRLDPNHPIRVGHMVNNLVSTLQRYNAAVDIVGCNPYVIAAPYSRQTVMGRPDGRLVDSPNQTLSAVGDFTAKMMRVAEGRAVWMQIQGSANENWFSPHYTPEGEPHGVYEYAKLYPSRWQMRFMAYQTIVRGATAMEWMLYGLDVSAEPWRQVCSVVTELRMLQEVLAAPRWRGSLRLDYRELGFSDWSGVETLTCLYNSEPWIIAVNTQFDPAEATLSNLPDGVASSLVVVGENRKVDVKKGAFTDWFQPYEVHVYGPAGSASALSIR